MTESYSVMLESERYGGSFVFLECRTPEAAEKLVSALIENTVGDQYDSISICGPNYHRNWKRFSDGTWSNQY